MNLPSKYVGGPNPLEQTIARVLPEDWTHINPTTIVQELEEGRREHYFQIFRAYRGDGWKPDVEIEGLGHIQEACAAGQGTILWIYHFVFNGLLPKQFLAQAGYSYAHLSRPEHGFSKTAFGIRFLNPIRSNVEDRYLSERIKIQRGAEEKSVRSLIKRLKQGKIISITAGAWEGRKTASAMVFGQEYVLAKGAPAIAHATGAALIPVAVVRCDTTGKFRIILRKPICLAKTASKTEAVNQAMSEYATQLEPIIKANPGQWRGWKYLRETKATKARS